VPGNRQLGSQRQRGTMAASRRCRPTTPSVLTRVSVRWRSPTRMKTTVPCGVRRRSAATHRTRYGAPLNRPIGPQRSDVDFAGPLYDWQRMGKRI